MVNEVEPKDRNIAMVFQSYALYPHMTVFNNMSFSLKLRKIKFPIYEANVEADEIKEKNILLFKEINKLNRTIRKKNEPKELLEKRESILKEIYANEEKRKSLLVPCRGISEVEIKDAEQLIKKINDDIVASKKSLVKVDKDHEKMEKYLAKEKLSEENKKQAEKNIKMLDDYKRLTIEGIEQKHHQIKIVEEQLEHFKNDEVDLVEYRKHTPYEIKLEVYKAAEILDLSRYLFRKPAALSGGQRQRVALGRAIVRHPKVFLMDEPLSNLDAKLRVQMRSEIVKLHNELGATTIYVTHDQIEAMTMASRIVVMSKGWVQQIGTPKVIYNHPANTFVATFIGSPAMNIIEGVYYPDHIDLSGVISIKLDKEMAKAHDEFYKEQIESANNRIKEIEDTLRTYEETKLNKKGQSVPVDEEALKNDLENDPEIIKLREDIKHYESCLNAKEGHPILFGIRPEDILEKTSSVLVKNPSKPISLKLSIAELLGNEYYAHVDFAGKDVIAKVNAELNIENGQQLELVLNLDKYLLFDKVNGANIKPYKE